MRVYILFFIPRQKLRAMEINNLVLLIFFTNGY